jgi:Ca2+-binding EF-hand superfamily protein
VLRRFDKDNDYKISYDEFANEACSREREGDGEEEEEEGGEDRNEEDIEENIEDCYAD